MLGKLISWARGRCSASNRYAAIRQHAIDNAAALIEAEQWAKRARQHAKAARQCSQWYAKRGLLHHARHALQCAIRAAELGDHSADEAAQAAAALAKRYV